MVIPFLLYLSWLVLSSSGCGLLYRKYSLLAISFTEMTQRTKRQKNSDPAALLPVPFLLQPSSSSDQQRHGRKNIRKGSCSKTTRGGFQ